MTAGRFVLIAHGWSDRDLVRLASVVAAEPGWTTARARRWVERARAAEVGGIGDRPVCAGCGLVRGLGFRDAADRFVQVDPCPSDRGMRRRDRWFCTEDCFDFWMEDAP